MFPKLFLPILALGFMLCAFPLGAAENVQQNFNRQSPAEKLKDLQTLYRDLYAPPALREETPAPLPVEPPPIAAPKTPAEDKQVKQPSGDFLKLKAAPAAPKEKPAAIEQPAVPAVVEKEPSVPLLAAGDKVSIVVTQEPDLSGERELDENGMAELPLIGKVKLAGATLEEAAQLITTAYLDGYLVNPQVSVTKAQEP